MGVQKMKHLIIVTLTLAVLYISGCEKHTRLPPIPEIIEVPGTPYQIEVPDDFDRAPQPPIDPIDIRIG